MRNNQENDEKKFNEEEIAAGLALTRATLLANVMVGDKDEGKNGLEAAASNGWLNVHPGWGLFFFLTT